MICPEAAEKAAATPLQQKQKRARVHHDTSPPALATIPRLTSHRFVPRYHQTSLCLTLAAASPLLIYDHFNAAFADAA